MKRDLIQQHFVLSSRFFFVVFPRRNDNGIKIVRYRQKRYSSRFLSSSVVFSYFGYLCDRMGEWVPC